MGWSEDQASEQAVEFAGRVGREAAVHRARLHDRTAWRCQPPEPLAQRQALLVTAHPLPAVEDLLDLTQIGSWSERAQAFFGDVRLHCQEIARPAVDDQS